MLPAPSFPVPAWLAQHNRDARGPAVLAVESTGPNLLDLLAAVRLAVEDAGPVARLEVADDHRDPEAAQRIAHGAQGIDVVIGHFGSRTAAPAGRVYAERDVVFLAPGSSRDDLCGPHTATTFQFFGRDGEQRDCLVGAARAAKAQVSVLGQARNYGETLGRSVCEALGRGAHFREVVGPKDWPQAAASSTIYVLCGSQEFAEEGLQRLGRGSAARPILLSDDSFGASFLRPFPHVEVAFLERVADLVLDQPEQDLRRRAYALLKRAPGAYFVTTYLAARVFLEAWWRGVRRGDAPRVAALAGLGEGPWRSPFGDLRLDAARRLQGHRWRMCAAGQGS